MPAHKHGGRSQRRLGGRRRKAIELERASAGGASVGAGSMGAGAAGAIAVGALAVAAAAFAPWPSAGWRSAGWPWGEDGSSAFGLTSSRWSGCGSRSSRW
jgi:hypothetical protein